jgi:hypothetical protein
MSHEPVLSEAEWRLVLELLERESHYLPVEIHHTDKRSYRADLRSRLDIITDMAERIRRHIPDAVVAEERLRHT